MIKNLLIGLWLANPRLCLRADPQKFPRCQLRPGVDPEKISRCRSLSGGGSRLSDISPDGGIDKAARI